MSLVVENLQKRFGQVVALDGISFSVEPGRIFGLLGANGAGKTTCMRIVLDILRPDGGSVTWQGKPNIALPRDTWGYLPEERGLYLRMKVIDVLRFFAAPGNQQKIQFIAAILHDPDVLIMDEPFSGLDPVNVQLLKEAFLEMRDRGKTLIFSTHQMETVEELCESIAIIDRGHVVVSGLVRDVKRAMGRQVVRLATDGDNNGSAWVETMDGVRITSRREDFIELRVPAGTDPEEILRAALQRGERVTRFEIADPSLEEVFIEHVGRPAAAEEERHLAAAGRAVAEERSA